MSTQHKFRGLLLDWRLLLYNAVIIVGSPYFLLRKFRRQLKRDNVREFRTFNWMCPLLYRAPQKEKSSAPHVVFVSVGLGEMHTTQQLDHALRQIRPDVRTTWAVRAPDTALVVHEKYPQQAVTAIPYDFLIPIWLWLRRLDPDVVVMVEKLMAPNIIWGSRRWGAGVLAACGQVGAIRSAGIQAACWQPIHRWILRGYSGICFQSSTEMDSIADLLPPGLPLRVTGRVKLSQVHRSGVDDDEHNGASASLSQWLSARASKPLLVAGSTKNIEEETLILQAFEIVRARFPCTLVIAPRRPHRVEETLTLLAEFGVGRVSRRSEYLNGALPDDSVDIYILDTLGELSNTYGLAQAAFVGGTLQGPGHNVIEPVEWGVPVSFGPGAGKPTVEQQTCIEAGVGFCVRDAQELADFWLHVLQEDTWREELRERAQLILREQQQAVAANVAVIVQELSTLSRSQSTQLLDDDN